LTWVTTTRPDDGGAFAPSEASQQFFDFLAARAVVLASGVQRMTTNAARLEIPRVKAGPAINWTTEADSITQGDPDADLVTAVPRKLAALVPLSNEMLLDSSPSVSATLSKSIARAMASKLDLGFLAGTGTPPQPTGLLTQAGVTTPMATNGAPLADLDPIAAAIGTLETAGASASAIFMHPRTWAEIAVLKESDDSIRPVVSDGAGSPTDAPRRSLYGVPVWTTSALPVTETRGTATNASSILVADVAQVYVVMRQDLKIEFDRSFGFGSDVTYLRATIRADIVVNDPDAVVRISGVTPS
jgi:HK97 family phage major capsid protein